MVTVDSKSYKSQREKELRRKKFGSIASFESISHGKLGADVDVKVEEEEEDDQSLESGSNNGNSKHKALGSLDENMAMDKLNNTIMNKIRKGRSDIFGILRRVSVKAEESITSIRMAYFLIYLIFF